LQLLIKHFLTVKAKKKKSSFCIIAWQSYGIQNLKYVFNLGGKNLISNQASLLMM